VLLKGRDQERMHEHNCKSKSLERMQRIICTRCRTPEASSRLKKTLSERELVKIIKNGLKDGLFLTFEEDGLGKTHDRAY